MNSADKIRRFFEKAELGINSVADEQVFQDVHQAQQQIINNTPAKPEIWRIIMKSPIVKFSVAAVFAIACLTGIFMFTSTQGIALADVIERIDQIRAYSCRMNAAFSNENIDNMPVSQGSVLLAKDLGMRLDIGLNHPGGESMFQEIYVMPDKGTITTIMPNLKQYSRVELDDGAVEAWEKEYDPRFLVERIQECKHASLGRSVIEGIEVEGFQTIDPEYSDGVLVDVAVKMWVDVETKLPVRMEAEKGSRKTGLVNIVIDDFQWDVPFETTQFEPVIPEDYTPGQPMMQLGPGN
jgi:outer membrane lipoprotein-sorting protein